MQLLLSHLKCPVTTARGTPLLFSAAGAIPRSMMTIGV
jgi:hypothetical protein